MEVEVIEGAAKISILYRSRHAPCVLYAVSAYLEMARAQGTEKCYTDHTLYVP